MSLLVVCESEEQMQFLNEALEPLFPKAIYSSTMKDAAFRLQNQEFPVVLYACETDTLKMTDVLSLLEAPTENPSHWIFLNIEELPKALREHSKISHLPKGWKIKQLLEQIDSHLPQMDNKKAPSKDDIQLAGNLINTAYLNFQALSENSLSKEKVILLNDDNPPTLPEGIASMIELEGENSKGQLYFYIPNELSTTLSKGKDKAAIEKSILGLTYRVSEKVSHELKKLGHDFSSSVKIIPRDEGPSRRITNHLNLCLPCQTPTGQLFIEVGLRFKN